MSKCAHISLLPKMPDGEELISVKPQSKQIKPPLVEDGDNGGHAELGWFKVAFEGEFFIEWNLKNKKKKKQSLKDLCESADLEMDRLELGWLIGNIFSLNEIHHLEKLGPAGYEQDLKEIARIGNWYEKKEKAWYQWAFAKIEHKK